MKIVLLPHAGGLASYYYFLNRQEYLIENIDYIYYEYDGHGSRSSFAPYQSFKDGVEKITEDLYNRLYGDEFILFGHNMGAAFAFEVALRLEKQYDLFPRCVIVSGQVPPHQFKQCTIDINDEEALLEYLRVMGGVGIMRKETSNMDFFVDFIPIICNDFGIMNSYTPSTTMRLKSPLLVFYGSADNEVVKFTLHEWQLYTKKFFGMSCFDGDHFYIQDQKKRFTDEIKKLLRFRLGVAV